MVYAQADPKHGGKPWAQLVADCPLELEAKGRFGGLPAEYMRADGGGDVIKWAEAGWFANAAEAPTSTQQVQFASQIFEGQTPIMWHRLPDLCVAGIRAH